MTLAPQVRTLFFISAGVVCVLMLALLMTGLVYAKKPEGGVGPGGQAAPTSTPQERQWFAAAKNAMNGSCCSEADGYREGFAYPWGNAGDMRLVFSEWKPSTIEGEYEVRVLGKWYHVDKAHVVPCGKAGHKDFYGHELPDQQCNPTGGAVVWVILRTTGFTMVNRDIVDGIRCFAPGFQT